MATITIAPSLANKAGVSVGTDKACSNKRSKNDKYYNNKSIKELL